MDHFLQISEEKQIAILNAKMQVFGGNGYKKASVGDIAKAAGISKSMVFYYFGSKKSAYLYVFHYCIDLIASAMTQTPLSSTPDFFDRLLSAAKIKLSLMKKHPSILVFLNGACQETAKEVFAEIRETLSQNALFSRQTALDGIDASKFKPDVDPLKVYKIISYFIEGYLSKVPIKTNRDIDAMIHELDGCIHMMRSNFYREGPL